MRSSLVSILPLALLLSASACSSSGDDAAAPDARAGELHGADVWKDGLVLSGTVTIAADGVVDIEPGARITCAEGATLYVAGTLRARAAAKHAKITCPRWAGLVVSRGGKVDLEGVEIENALLGLGTAEGAGEARFVDGAITSSLKPFFVSPATKLVVERVKVTTPDQVAETELSISDVHGTLIASRLEYDAKSNEGLSAKKGGDITIQDSVLKGKNGRDLVSSYGGKHVRISYTTMDGAHCGVHIDADPKSKHPTDAFEIDHVTSDPNIYAMTIYASGPGPNIVRDSNLVGIAAWLDFQGENGPITFDGVYTSGNAVLTGGPVPPTVKNEAKSPRTDAKPR